MTNICNFLSIGLLLNHLDSGRQVVQSHLVEGKIPEELLVMVGVKRDMRSTVCIAARVSQPDIISSTCCYKSWRYICIVHDPGIGRVETTVLEENGRFATTRNVAFFLKTRDSEDTQIISILRRHCMCLKLEAILDTNLTERFVRIELMA